MYSENITIPRDTAEELFKLMKRRLHTITPRDSRTMFTKPEAAAEMVSLRRHSYVLEDALNGRIV